MPAIPFSMTMVGLVVRGKRNVTHEPGVMDQHADCILPGGAPIGFFGEGPNRSGGANSASSMKVGLNLRGVVYDYRGFLVNRPWYVNLAEAKTLKVVSTILTINVGATTAVKFAAYWAKLRASPGGFDLLGNNCSTHASDAFVATGILKDGIPGLDTPNNLYRQLSKELPGTISSYSGCVGFSPATTPGMFDVVVE
jgi:hypothetical protein